MEIELKIIDKEYNKTCRTIYEAIYDIYFGEITLFTDQFLEKCKKNPNVPHNIPSNIKTINTVSQERSYYYQVVMIRRKSEVKEVQKSSNYK